MAKIHERKKIVCDLEVIFFFHPHGSHAFGAFEPARIALKLSALF